MLEAGVCAIKMLPPEGMSLHHVLLLHPFSFPPRILLLLCLSKGLKKLLSNLFLNIKNRFAKAVAMPPQNPTYRPPQNALGVWYRENINKSLPAWGCVATALAATGPEISFQVQK